MHLILAEMQGFFIYLYFIIINKKSQEREKFMRNILRITYAKNDTPNQEIIYNEVIIISLLRILLEIPI